ncbi:hypothetical protein GCM10012289_33770 [Nonomuraea cavernae]|uniref:Uncharacterized protein n=1 Tax=Nonomuraea cavernae TaxID=2045107 RepID=A0A917Z1J1_9ACTN|nr:hypothetical protein GCM10012289_33770 [Nonomuraea cavernae]
MNGLRVRCSLETVRRNSLIVQHAVVRGTSKALCGEAIRLIMIDDWHVPFVPTLASACEECVRVLASRMRS